MAYLREHARVRETDNDALRTPLGVPPAGRVRRTEPAIPGALLPLITSGVLTPGQSLTWVRPRRRDIHEATVDEIGRMVVVGDATFTTPDTCASAIGGHACKGWPNWRTTAGATLQQLRDQTAPPGT